MVSPATAKDQPAPEKLTTPRGVADAVLRAVEKKDDEALEALARPSSPDPWLVVEDLCTRGEHDAASAYAKALKGSALDKTPDYVAQHEQAGADPSAKAFDEIRKAVASKDYAAAIRQCEALPERWTVTRLRLAEIHALCLLRSRRRADAIPVIETAAGESARVGWLMQAGRWYDWAAENHHATGNAPKALANLKEAQAHYKAAGDSLRSAGALQNLGLIQNALGQHAEALATMQEALDAAQALDNESWVANTLGNMGNAYSALGDFADALKHYRRALKHNQKLKRPREVADLHRRIGLVYEKTGDLGRAMGRHQRALRYAESAKDAALLAASLRSVGQLHVRLGDHAKALELQERALAYARKTDNKIKIANALHTIGATYWSFGDYPRASLYLERALDAFKSVGNKPGISSMLTNLGILQVDLENYDAAQDYLAQAEKLMKERGVKRGMARVLGAQATVHLRRKAYPRALELAQQALALYQAIRDKAGTAEAFATVGWLQVLMDKWEEGLQNLGRAERESYPLRDRSLRALCLKRLAGAHLRKGEPREAAAWARKAVAEVESLVAGLAEEQGALARGEWREVFKIGALAAARLDDPAEALLFLESGRAGALLESLNRRQSRRWAKIPDALRQENTKVRVELVRAREAYLAAVTEGLRDKTRAARHAMSEAIERVRDVSDRIQRETKGQAAGFFYPRAVPIDRIQDILTDGAAFVLFGLAREGEVVYGLELDEAFAVVVTPESARVVSLGSAKQFEDAFGAFSGEDRQRPQDAAVATLRKRLVDPLRLDPAVKRVLISPQGPLCYIPFGMLFPHEVALTPSGTTHVLLHEEAAETAPEPGEKRRILAVGDPDYAGHRDAGKPAMYLRGRLLPPLEHSREEATSIGDEVLLGAEANEAALREALAKETRWLAVHLACHGFVDPERPGLSALILSPTKDEDGFLTGLEVLSMDIPADLAVLSACETGKGKVIDGEGIMGLTRAFMFAGAPRVICSLWNADDEATQPLMRKFYELWRPKDGKPGLGAAAALRKAQEHVRTFVKVVDGKETRPWAHPYYWGGWTLWGLPQ